MNPGEPGRDEPARYLVVPDSGRYCVNAPSGRTVLVCGDKASAMHYATLLGEAYRSGYQAASKSGR